MADISWDEDGVPVSVKFDDPYFSLADGWAETRHVFINGNDLPARWSRGETPKIAELGFGTGLNFFATVLAYRAAGGTLPLSYMSFEKHPVTRDQGFKALEPWADLAELAEHFLEGFPPEPGWHTVEQGDVTLTLAIGDANEMVADYSGVADAWYLDGFSPAKNPELWNATLLEKVAQRTSNCGTFATYTAAGFVRRNLKAAGFDVERIPGYGRKRHMTRGILKRSE
ncbi:MAG: tRNA (5-methylaminomethyl-2-thiouridine)(34)-methyltransferase MnmD [Pseudomonadota bacterium]